MFDSGLSVAEVLADLRQEVDIAIPITDATYISWLNALQQMLYTEIIQEQAEIIVENPSGGVVFIDDLDTPDDENSVRFEDIHAIYADDTQLIKSTLASGVVFQDTFYKVGNNIGYHVKSEPMALRIVYYVKPKLLKADQSGLVEGGNVMLPIEFIDFVRAKLRGEAYKVANEDALAAKWLNDYNVLLENFKVWVSGKASQFGL